MAYAVNSSAVITDTKGQLEKSMPPENTRVILSCVKCTTTSPTFLRIDGEVSWSLFPSSLSCAITQYSTTRKCLFLYRPGKKKKKWKITNPLGFACIGNRIIYRYYIAKTISSQNLNIFQSIGFKQKIFTYNISYNI